jgi:phosphoribosylformylglycinamidine synthase
MTYTYRIEVYTKHSHTLTETEQTNRFVQASSQVNIDTLTGCFLARLYFLHGDFSEAELEQIAQTYLADEVTEDYSISSVAMPQTLASGFSNFIEVTTLAGVTNSPADNLAARIQQAKIGSLDWAASGTRYCLAGELSASDLKILAERLFANPVIQYYSINQAIMPAHAERAESSSHVEVIAIMGQDDDSLLKISSERRLALDLNEMKAVRDYFEEEQRDPTDLELETIAQTWSEHCVHKTFRANITFNKHQQIDGLLKTYIRGATDQLNKSWLRSVFVDDAGIIRFDDDYDLAFKVETHNHPSAIEPFGGANTGVGGVVRDVLGVSAKPIANTDVLCFGRQDIPLEKIPSGTLHPTRIAEGVVHGVEDYGNKMGIPTVNGAVLYEEGYTANPLVFCGCLGLLPHGSHPTEAQTGDFIIVIGGRTGRDGLRGATFSSMEMDATTGTVAGSSVQIGNPITEKQVQEVIIRARDEQLYHAITDCGAGGLSSSVGEMGETIGTRVQLQAIPLKYHGLHPWEIWLSEAQERMVLAVPPENWPRLQEICAGQDVEAVNIGRFEASGRLQIFDGERMVGNLTMSFLHDGIPIRQLEALWEAPKIEAPDTSNEAAFSDVLYDLLAHPNISSKENIVRRYDHEIQGGTSVKPFGGVNNHSHNDAAVLVPIGRQGELTIRAVTLSNGICPQYSALDPYAMSWAAIDEAVRNAVAVGADPEQIAILDNFCWGNPNLADRLGSLVRCVQGCYDAALAYGTPYISGKDSLNNEYTDSEGQRHAIPGTLLISAVGIVPDVSKTATADFKQSGHAIYVIGTTRAELGQSHYSLVTDMDYPSTPQPVENALDIMKAMHKAIQAELVAACHDPAEGGLAVALAEMAIGGELGFSVDLSKVTLEGNLTSNEIAFSESLSRFIVEVAPENSEAFEAIFAGLPFARIGEVQAGDSLNFASTQLSLVTARQQWQGIMPATATITEKAAFAGLPVPAVHTRKPRVLILHANGTNRDHEAALACSYAGAEAEIVHINQLRSGERQFSDYHMLLVPGGFSYGDDLGAGRLWSLDLRYDFAEAIDQFVSSGRPVMGICNGFQTLVKSGLLPDGNFSNKVTLTYNESEHFECRWVYLKPNPDSPSLFTQNLSGLIYAPVAHGEGRVMTIDDATTEALQNSNLDALSYVNADGSPASYPANPNGSVAGIAGLSNAAGNVFGLMPHPENHIFAWQHPRYHRGEAGGLGLSLFVNAVRNS